MKAVADQSRHSQNGVKLEGGKALLNVGGGSFRREVGVTVQVGRYPAVMDVVGCGSLVGYGVQVGVRAEFLVNLPAKQVINGLIEGFADYIPTGYLNSAKHSYQR